MKQCDVPNAFEVDLGYRKVRIEAGKRYYTDEVADAMPQFVVEEQSQEEHHKRRSATSERS